MPIATKAAVKNLTAQELKELGAEIILSNTYHLIQRPGLKVLDKAGGLHKFMNWDGPILTDSGGFQIFSLSKKRRVDDSGVKFQSEIDGKEIYLTPEKSIGAQLSFDSDIIMVLDECPAWPINHNEAEKSLCLTLKWALKSKKYFGENVAGAKNYPKNKKPLLFGIIQGSTFKDLRKKSVREMLKIGFDGYAIGGVSVGEPKKEKESVLKLMDEILPQDKPRYVMGYGKPEEIAKAVSFGMDIFDCVIPTREARHGRIYKLTAKKINLENPNFYETIAISKSKFAKNYEPIDKKCGCFTCKNHSLAYLNHLFRTKESLAMRLASIHNLRFYISLMEKLRKILI